MMNDMLHLLATRGNAKYHPMAEARAEAASRTERVKVELGDLEISQAFCIDAIDNNWSWVKQRLEAELPQWSKVMSPVPAHAGWTIIVHFDSVTALQTETPRLADLIERCVNDKRHMRKKTKK